MEVKRNQEQSFGFRRSLLKQLEIEVPRRPQSPWMALDVLQSLWTSLEVIKGKKSCSKPKSQAFVEVVRSH